MSSPAAWMEKFPGLARLSPDLVAKLSADSAVVALPEGTRIYGPGQAPESYLRNHGIQARFVDDNGGFTMPQDVHTHTGVLSYDPAAGQLRTELNVTPPSVWMEAADSNQAPSPAVLNVLCLNCATGPWQAETDEAWLQLSSTNDTLEVKGVPDGLAPGIYQGEVLVSLPSDTSVAPVLVKVTMTVGDIDQILPEKLYLPAVIR